MHVFLKDIFKGRISMTAVWKFDPRLCVFWSHFSRKTIEVKRRQWRKLWTRWAAGADGHERQVPGGPIAP